MNRNLPLLPRLLRSPAILIILSGLLGSLPVLIAGFPLQSHDGRYHPTWVSLFSRQFWSGDLYPRWLFQINSGLGDPTFYFYPPLPYYLAVPFGFLDSIDPIGIYRLAIVSTIVLVASGLAAWLWLRELTSRTWLTTLGALFYMLAPYHLSIDLYVRGAFTEFCAFVWPPLIMYGIHRICSRKPFGIAIVALSWSGLMLTHPPTVLIVAPIIALYPLFIAEQGARLRTFAKWFGGVLLGTGVATIYWLPAFVHRDYININTILAGSFNFARNFVIPHFGSPATYSGGLFWLVLYSLFFVALAWIGWSRQTSRYRFYVLWTLTALYAVFMMLPFSRFAWELIPSMESVAFPFRFHLLLTLAVVGFIGSFDMNISTSVFRTKLVQWLVVGGTALSLPITLLVLRNTYDHTSNLYQENYDRNLRMIGRQVGALEYVTRWAFPIDPRRGDVTYRSYMGIGSRFGGELQALVVEGEPIQIKTLAANKYILQVRNAGGSICDVNRFYYPGWVALAGEKEMRIEPVAKLGFIRIHIPPGVAEVILTRKAIPPEGISLAVSLLSLGGIIFLLIWEIRKKKQTQKEIEAEGSV